MFMLKKRIPTLCIAISSWTTMFPPLVATRNSLITSFFSRCSIVSTLFLDIILKFRILPCHNPFLREWILKWRILVPQNEWRSVHINRRFFAQIDPNYVHCILTLRLEHGHHAIYAILVWLRANIDIPVLKSLYNGNSKDAGFALRNKT